MIKRVLPAILLLLSCSAWPQKASLAVTHHVMERNIRAHEEFLASDALQGRGSATRDEWIAATYVATQFRQFGLDPAGDPAGENPYIQTVSLTSTPNQVELSAGETHLQHGRDMAILLLANTKVSAALNKVQVGAIAQKGSAAFIHLTEGANDPSVRDQIRKPLQQGAAVVLFAYSEQLKHRFQATLIQEVRVDPAHAGTILLLGPEATKAFESLPDGIAINISSSGDDTPKFTYNTIGMVKGSDPARRSEAILITAHVDHLGIHLKQAGDNIFNGADDDASGVVAVLELARAVAAAKPKRTVYFVTFGSEETGGAGAQFFLQHPPVALSNIVANLEFEMIGRPDPKVAPDTLWLTGFDRSNLGPMLAQHGARLVGDPHPAEQFFTRSDNYALAKRGVIAHTVSSFGLHKEYHSPADDIAHLDVQHMTRAIQSMVKPVIWLGNSEFKPKWNEGKKP